MKKVIFAALAVMAFAAQAGSNNNGDTNNNYDQRSYGGNTTNAGGAGGSATALAGAVATGGNASATGGAVIGSGNSSATGGTVRDSGNSAVIGSGNSSSTSGVKNSGNSAATAAVKDSGNSAADVDVSIGGAYHEAQKRAPVSTAYAAGLTATNGTCFGSASVGAQGVGFGVSFGSTTFDDNCDRRYDSQELRALGQAEAALALMCQKDSVAQAMKASGKSCHMQGTTNTTSVAVSAPTAKYEHTDPIVRARLGLPPLK